VLDICFYPDHNNLKLSKATEEYGLIWKEERGKIGKAISDITGLNFKTKKINAIVYEGSSYSYPLKLRASHSKTLKKTTLVHELFHRIFLDNKIKFEGRFYSKEWDYKVHKIISLFLYFTLKQLYGDEVLNANVKKESKGERKKIWVAVLKLSDSEKREYIRSFMASQQ
jgi:hypothetical protein